jgi:hypothetical protein
MGPSTHFVFKFEVIYKILRMTKSPTGVPRRFFAAFSLCEYFASVAKGRAGRVSRRVSLSASGEPSFTRRGADAIFAAVRKSGRFGFSVS